MCGRYCSDLRWSDIAKLYDLSMEGPPHWNFEPNYNVCPTQTVATIVQRDGKRAFELMRWGIIPMSHRGSAKERKFATFNARTETIKKLRTFRNIWKRNRCLIPVSGYFEWNHREGAPKTQKPRPYYFTAALKRIAVSVPARGAHRPKIPHRRAALSQVETVQNENPTAGEKTHVL